MQTQAELDALWQEILAKVQESLTQDVCQRWLAPLRPVSLDQTTLTLATESETARQIIEKKYIPFLEDALFAVRGEEKNVVLETEAHEEKPAAKKESRPSPRKIQKAERAAHKTRSRVGLVREDGPVQQSLLDAENLVDDAPEEEKPAPRKTRSSAHALPSPIAPGDASTLNPKYTFDTFVTGKSNQLAHAASLSVAENPGHSYNPLFLYGGVGLGKTHLMHAIGHRILANHPEMRVLYVSSEKFTNDLINSIQDNHQEAFRDKYRTIDVLMVDDVQFVAGKSSTQEEFFHTFNALHDDNKQIILSSDRPPKELEKLEERLRSRFEWGLITDIQPPDLETRIAILRKKATVDHLDVPNDVMFTIANRIDTNIRELEGALTRVVAYASLMKQPITSAIAEEALKDLFPTKTKEVTLEIIQEVVASYFGIQVDDLHAKKRNRSIAYPRQVAMYLCRELTDSSLPAIGQFFGGRDHTTVLHAYEKIKKEKETDEKLHSTLGELMERLQNI